METITSQRKHDEVEKGLAGSTGSGANDSGVTKRIMGTILTWLQERTKPVFVIATANDVTSLPPELYRRGRWDEVWSVDLPTASERAQILKVILGKKGRGKVAVPESVEGFDGFTGAEIEAAVDNALYAAFYDGAREPTIDDVLTAAKSIVPLATMAKGKVEEIRRWAKENARLVSSPDGVNGAKKQAGPGQRKLTV